MQRLVPILAHYKVWLKDRIDNRSVFLVFIVQLHTQVVGQVASNGGVALIAQIIFSFLSDLWAPVQAAHAEIVVAGEKLLTHDCGVLALLTLKNIFYHAFKVLEQSNDFVAPGIKSGQRFHMLLERIDGWVSLDELLDLVLQLPSYIQQIVNLFLIVLILVWESSNLLFEVAHLMLGLSYLILVDLS